LSKDNHREMLRELSETCCIPCFYCVQLFAKMLHVAVSHSIRANKTET